LSFLLYIKTKIKLSRLKGVLLLSLLFVAAFFLARGYKSIVIERETNSFAPYLEIEGFNPNDAIHRELLRESLNVFYPENHSENQKTYNDLEKYIVDKYTNPLFKEGADPGYLTFSKIPGIIWQFIPFIIIFAIVLLITYYGSVTLGSVKYINYKNRDESAFRRLLKFLATSMKQKKFYRKKYFYVGLFSKSLVLLVTALGYLVLFSPAYVTAYSIRTEINTDTYLFMILLGIFTNGILINYINKYFTFLYHEGKKGYVETAMVKNLNENYNDKMYFSFKKMVKPFKKFDGHVFGHIYKNAEFQFIPGIKDLASFLITGLIIIEMALNIQGHFGYELLKQVLFKNYDVVVFYIFMIFLLVKTTEFFVDSLDEIIKKKYEN